MGKPCNQCGELRVESGVMVSPSAMIQIICEADTTTSLFSLHTLLLTLHSPLFTLNTIKEIGGTSPLYFDSDNIDQISSLMQKIVEDKELRKNIVFDSILWANEFNWEKTVRQTLAVF